MQLFYFNFVIVNDREWAALNTKKYNILEFRQQQWPTVNIMVKYHVQAWDPIHFLAFVYISFLGGFIKRNFLMEHFFIQNKFIILFCRFITQYMHNNPPISFPWGLHI